ncbi:MAG: hypothetical protein MJ009_07910 [Paludibacteraceae bacterium]|nr:hypothetical protein [Paludibacteraceae bacterium]
MNKKVLLIVLLVPCLLLCAQSYFYVYYSDGRTIQYDSAKADSVNYNSTANEFGVIKGGKAVTSFPAANVDSISAFAADGNMERCTADMYKQVNIGGQVWLAENYRCSKYDTESEAYKNGMYVIPKSATVKTTPYYAPSADANPEFGYYYSWAAAVGVEAGKSQTEEFDGPRQGVCPNGWHLPTLSEWTALQTFIEVADGKGADTAGKHLKSASGWNDGGNGLDTYNFAVYPSGFYNNAPDEVGKSSQMWTATPTDGDNGRAINALFGSTNNKMNNGNGLKGLGRTVRCVKNTETVKDACGNTYPVVTIGNQVWMAENMRCNKYDTESERAGVELSTSSSTVYTPYYTAIPGSSKPDYMTDEQFGKLGYLYNWAAAVGLEDGQTQTSAFTGNRQGICPNGWHMPSVAEWNTLRDFLGGQSVAGKKMKTSTGWQSGTGEGDNGFAALPAGHANGSSVTSVGRNAYYWSSDAYDSNVAYDRFLNYSNAIFNESYFDKGNAYGVRCVKDPLNITVAHGRIEKTSTKEKLNRLWLADDAISMFVDANGDANSFTLKSGAGSNSATFEGTVPAAGDEYVAFYPTTITQSITEASGTSSVNFTMPQEQNVTAAGEINATTLPMLGYSTDTEIAMKNVGSLLELGLKTKEGTANVVKIELQGNDNEKLSGAFAVEVKKDGTQPIAVASGETSDADKTLTVNCGAYESGKYNGIEINSTEFTNFYISIPAKVFAKGFTATISASGGKIVTITTTTDISVGAAKLAEFALTDVEFTLLPRPACQKALDDESNWVKIGTLYWLRENTRCAEYDSLSEAFYADWLTDNTIPASGSSVYTPYYAGVQMDGYGGYYNWAAAVGVADGKAQAVAFTEPRQGICPNGSHIPTRDEWITLKDYVASNTSWTPVGEAYVRLHLKSTSGWFSNGNGDNKSGFAAQPAGNASGSYVSGISQYTDFWSATTCNERTKAYDRSLGYENNTGDFSEFEIDKKSGLSVRCIKDPEPTAIDACGNEYKLVKIGGQVWTKENMRCNKYSPNSEAGKDGRTEIPLVTGDSEDNEPFYYDGTGKGYGYYYNWTAAVGLADGYETTGYSNINRQGVCPDGFHIPTSEEWSVLFNSVANNPDWTPTGSDYACHHLKSKTGWGWHDEDEEEPDFNGDNKSGFSCLPAGAMYGYDYREDAKVIAYLWASDNVNNNESSFYYLDGSHNKFENASGGKEFGQSVRCVKNTPTPTTGEAEITGGTKVKWVQLWENGPKWAEYNVGSDATHDYNAYYTWGGSYKNGTGIEWNGEYNTGSASLSGDTDTATKLWGSNWQMPTKADFEALIANCDVVWKTASESGYNVAGRLYTGRGECAENSVFFPAVGDCHNGSVDIVSRIGNYWSSTPNDSDNAFYFHVDNEFQSVHDYFRDYGMSVRAILKEK